jgi:hypothetical protein
MEDETRPVGRVHPNHQEFSMSEIDDVHDPKDDGQTKGNQRKEKAHQYSLKDCVENDH